MRAPLPATLLLLACLAIPAARLSAATTHTSRAIAPLPEAPGCPLLPANNVWNRDISALPTAAGSAAIIQAIDPQNMAHLHPDFGSDPSYGIPYNVVGSGQPKLSVGFDYADDSDPGPYPIPPNPLVEAGSDRHILIVDKDACTLYELWDTSGGGQSWHAGSGAIWNLRSNALRPDGWTSADAAGLPILPGLARYDEVAAGVIDHALRFTLAATRKAHLYPARHDASGNTSPNLPPMGLRVRLKASVDISGFGPQARVVLTALKRYGMILADNGSNWYISGASNPSWQDDDLHGLGRIHSADLEVVDTSGLLNGPDPTGPTITATSTVAPLSTATPTATASPTVSPTRTPTATASATATTTSTAVSTATPSPSPSRAATATPTATASRTPTAPPTATAVPSATATPWQPGVVALTPVADTYVRDGQYSGTNFGPATSLYAKNSSSGYNRIAYLRFDLSGVRGTIVGATLQLYGRNTGGSTYRGNLSVYPVASTTWAEAGGIGITWNTRPALGGPALATAAITSGAARYYSWGVTAAVVQKGLLSLAVDMPSVAGSPDEFNAREATSNPPQLVLTNQ